MGLKNTISKAVNWHAPTVAATETLRDVIMKLAEKGVSAFAVTTAERVAGVITEMDIMHSIVTGKGLDNTTVGESMTPCDLITEKGAKNPCVQLHETETVANALGVMETAGVHNLLVSGDSDKKIGMVSIRDLLRIAID